MPYIDPKLRTKYNAVMAYIRGRDDSLESSGELNYLITKMCLEYLEKKEKNYTTYNEIVGVLECAKQEFYNRAVKEYEKIKCENNGDIFK